ncbi:MAG: methylaspartate mutase subunit E [Spirochaetia bacterium]
MRVKQLDRNEFLQSRGEVLAAWPTGAEVDLEEGVRYQRDLLPECRFSLAIGAARDEGRILLQPRAGVALLDEHIRLLQYLSDEGGADLLPTTIDAYTRQNRYQEAQAGIEKSLTARTSMLNGFPAVNHGVANCRRVVEAVNKPAQVRHGTPDARLLAEITLAAGFSSFEGGGISYNIPYTKRIPLETSLRNWMYVDRLAGYYEAEGAPINREPFGPLTGTLVPPFISHTVGILEGLLALSQGVRSLTLGYGQTGNLIQDAAAVISLRECAEAYFREAGFDDFDLTTVFHQWMGGFPAQESKAFAVITWGAAAAAFARADKIIVKTPHEAMGIPSMEANAQGLQASRQAISMLKDQHLENSPALERETDIIKREVDCVMQNVHRLSEGNLIDGIIRGFGAGVIDIPFAPSVYNHGKVLPIRDDEGFVRLYTPGSIPLNDDIMEFHRERLAARAASEGRDVSFQMVTDDIYAVSKGNLVGRPK